MISTPETKLFAYELTSYLTELFLEKPESVLTKKEFYTSSLPIK